MPQKPKPQRDLGSSTTLSRAVAVSLAIFLGSPLAVAGGRSKLTFSLGNYNYSAPGGSASGFATYTLAYSYDVFHNFQITAGADVTLAKFITGQAGFGSFFGFRYYPFTDAGVVTEQSGNVETVTWQVWRPFIGLAFRERTFTAAAQETYIGPGLMAGIDRQLNEDFSLTLQLDYDKLGGADSTTATQINALLGGSYHF